jgi:hypothetical protein
MVKKLNALRLKGKLYFDIDKAHGLVFTILFTSFYGLHRSIYGVNIAKISFLKKCLSSEKNYFIILISMA